MRAAVSLAALASVAVASPREVRIPAAGAALHAREVGRGQPIIVLHGGPDFDHTYLLPDMDSLADSYRLIYYDQRGRGRSADGVYPEDVTIDSDVADLDAVRQHFQLGAVALLGHSWGAVIALQYALRHPDRVSHLILMNPAPASKPDFLLLRKARLQQPGGDADGMKAIAATPGYRNGDPDTVAAYYRIHFAPALKRRAHLERVLASLRTSFTAEGILKARAVEDRLMQQTWLSPEYDLLPKLRALTMPTIVIYGDHDFIPQESAAHIAKAIPGARLVTMKDCGHFAYLECPGPTRHAIDELFAASRPAPRGGEAAAATTDETAVAVR